LPPGAEAKLNFMETTQEKEEERKKPVTFEQAKKLIVDGDHVHTFRNSNNVLFGCDWERYDLLERMKKHDRYRLDRYY
jgi:hypothetical protein